MEWWLAGMSGRWVIFFYQKPCVIPILRFSSAACVKDYAFYNACMYIQCVALMIMKLWYPKENLYFTFYWKLLQCTAQRYLSAQFCPPWLFLHPYSKQNALVIAFTLSKSPHFCYNDCGVTKWFNCGHGFVCLNFSLRLLYLCYRQEARVILSSHSTSRLVHIVFSTYEYGSPCDFRPLHLRISAILRWAISDTVLIYFQ